MIETLLTGPVYVAVLAGMFGLILGSFLNVCTFRWPNDESVVAPRSHCPSCDQLIVWYDNIPLVSYLILAGRCRSCAASISVQYPLVEFATGLIWAGLFWYQGLSGEALRGAIFLTILFGIALTDARYYLIPDEFSLGGLVLGLATAFLPGGPTAVQAALGSALGFVLLLGVAHAGKFAFFLPILDFEIERVVEADADTLAGRPVVALGNESKTRRRLEPVTDARQRPDVGEPGAIEVHARSHTGRPLEHVVVHQGPGGASDERGSLRGVYKIIHDHVLAGVAVAERQRR